jgi:hypothetical protein
MTKAPRPSAQTFAQFMASLPREGIDRVNELNRKEALEQHEAFSEAFKAGVNTIDNRAKPRKSHRLHGARTAGCGKTCFMRQNIRQTISRKKSIYF